MTDTAVVSYDFAHAGGLANNVTMHPGPHHTFPELRLSDGAIPAPAGHLEGLREQFSRAKEIPDKAIDLIMSSRRRKTVNNNYNSAWKLWEELVPGEDCSR